MNGTGLVVNPADETKAAGKRLDDYLDARLQMLNGSAVVATGEPT
jgi:hypothetical protein